MKPGELHEVTSEPLRLERFESIITADQYRKLMEAVAEAQRVFGERTIWNVNSTAVGGGVAEMLHSLVAYIRGARLDARWLVIAGGADFFAVTKRIHNHLHGSAGDGGPLDREAREVYERTLQPSADALAERLRPGDLVLLHDPQTAGLVPRLRRRGVHVVWRCHVGVDLPNERAREAWRFLLPYVRQAEATVFSREAFKWEGLERSRTWVIPPSIDAFSAKNRDLKPDQVDAILAAAGMLQGKAGGRAVFERRHGPEERVTHRAEMIETRPASLADRLVVQVSRWDHLKDPLGVIKGFARHVDADSNAHLVLAGPAVEAISDDPEGERTLRQATEAWHGLADATRERVHLACLPMEDTEENAAIVNALQRKAAVVVQKSVAEGFGLTVAEGMWKGRPVVASKIGGIQDQIQDGRTGLLLRDPRNLREFGRAVGSLLDDPERAERIGRAAREEVRDHFLGPRHLMQWSRLLAGLLAREGREPHRR